MAAPSFNIGVLARLFPAAAVKTARWAGRGFQQIEIPNHTGRLNGVTGARLLTHQQTHEVWTFEKAGVVPNRTFRPPAPGGQPDQFTSAISYSQHVTAKSGTLDKQPVTDPTMLGTIHGEKGFLIFNPTATTYGDPAGEKLSDPQQYIRLGSIPHGVSIMLSTAEKNPPDNASSSRVISHVEEFENIFDGNSQFKMLPEEASGAMPAGNFGYGESFTVLKPAKGLAISWMNEDLHKAIKEHGRFKKATVIHMGTPLVGTAQDPTTGGTILDPVNPPNLNSFAAAQTNFLARPGSVQIDSAGSAADKLVMPFANARVDNVEFWWSFIDLVSEFGQVTTIVQYAQAISLNFAGFQWPHITGATLRLHAFDA